MVGAGGCLLSRVQAYCRTGCGVRTVVEWNLPSSALMPLPGHMLFVFVSVACAVHIKADRTDKAGTAETACGFIPGPLGAEMYYNFTSHTVLSRYRVSAYIIV